MMPPGPQFVTPPAELWRVGWRTDPNGGPPPDPLNLSRSDAGNRYDAINGAYTVTYAATDRLGALLESVASFRVDPTLIPFVASWPATGLMAPGTISAGWRHKRTWARWAPPHPPPPFLDIAHHDTVAWLNREAAAVLASVGVGPLTIADVTGEDRVLTRLLATWIHNVTHHLGTAGIAYESKHGTDLRCWAIFDRANPDFTASSAISLGDPEIALTEDAFAIKFF